VVISYRRFGNLSVLSSGSKNLEEHSSHLLRGRSLKSSLISEAYDTKLLGIYADSALYWKNHIKQITQKWSTASYVTRSVKLFMSQGTLKMVYYACFHSIMTYGLMFWGNFSHSANIFKMPKNIIRLITGCRSRDSCIFLFKNLKFHLFNGNIYHHFSYFWLTYKINPN
jgi:hypothetical protein